MNNKQLTLLVALLVNSSGLLSKGPLVHSLPTAHGIATKALASKKLASEPKPKPKFQAPDPAFFAKLRDNLMCFTLENGLEVVLYKDATTPQVLTQLAYRVGAAAETSVERGMAHLVEHMIFKGTEEKMSELDIPAICTKFGASTNAATYYDWTAYYFLTDMKNYPRFLGVLADCAQNAKFDPEHLASELKTVVQELNMRRDNIYFSLISHAMQSLFPPNHPYHFDVIGYTKELADMKATHLKAFFKKYYHPANATLFVLGNINFEKAEKEIRTAFGSWVGGKPRVDLEMPRVPRETMTTDTTSFGNSSLACGCYYFYGPGLLDLETCTNFSFIAKIMTSESGRLTKRLVDQDKLATAVFPLVLRLDAGGPVGVGFMSTPENAEQCYKIVEEEMQKLFDNGVSEEEVELCKPTLVIAEIEKFESMMRISMELMMLHFATNDPYRIFDLVPLYSKVQAADLNATIQEWLDPAIVHKHTILPLDPHRRELWAKFDKQIKDDQEEILKKHQRTTPIEQPKLLHTIGDPELYNFTVPTADSKVLLDNGLLIIAKHQANLPMVKVILQNRDILLAQGTPDAAAVFVAGEALIEKSRGTTKKENTDFLDAVGARANFSLLVSVLSCSSSNLNSAIERFWHILANPEFEEETVGRISTNSAHGFRQASKDPWSVVFRNLQRRLFSGTSFDWDFAQAAERYEGVDLSQVQQAYSQTFQPQNYVLVICGDLPNHWLSSLKSHFQAWSGSGTFTQKKLPVPQQASGEQVEFHPMEQNQLYYAFGRGSDVTNRSPDQFKLQVLNKLLFGGMDSKIFEIRQQTGLFYSAGGSFGQGATEEYSQDSVMVLLNPGNENKFKEAVSKMFDDVKSTKFDSSKVNGVKHLLLNEFIQTFSSIGGLGYILANKEILGLPDDYYQKALETIQSTTEDDLVRLANTYCNLDRMVEVQAGGQAGGQ